MSEIKACQQIDCEIRNDGKCLEGLDSIECPHFYWSDGDIDDDVIAEPSVISQISNKISLFSGAELSLKDLSLITHRYECDLVIILGDLDSGKTTLLATIFDLFQLGKFESYQFAGSFTQKGFEIRSHLSRIASGNAVPDTERTKALEFRVLHLSIKDNSTLLLKHFLLSDISGETIAIARSSSSAMKEQLHIVKKADHIIYVIDGEKLSSNLRTATIMDAELFIKMAIDNNIFTNCTVLNILISKWDILEKISDFDLQASVVNKINTRFSKFLRKINFKKIASRPNVEFTSDIDLGYGVKELIDDFMRGNNYQDHNDVTYSASKRLIENFRINE